MRLFAFFALLCGLLIGLSPTLGQDSGLIIEGNPRGESSLTSLNPLRCVGNDCRRITSLMFPWLLRIDPDTGIFVPATETDGLVEALEIADGRVTYQLAADRRWSDGTPITVLDVYFSYLALVSGDFYSPYTSRVKSLVEFAAPLDETTITFALTSANCAASDMLNFPVIPAHVFDPSFAESVTFPDGDLAAWAASQPERDFSGIPAHPSDTKPTVTSGAFQFAERKYGEYIRLVSADEERAFAFVDVPSRSAQVDRFLRGDLNLLFEPPYEQRRDLRANGDVQLVELQPDEWFFIGLNMAHPELPLSAFDEDDGSPIAQIPHPIFGDVRVRRALQLAIDVPALIDATVEGSGQPIAAHAPPNEWASNPDLAPVGYDPAEAARLLEEAGWKDVNRDGVRECISCLHAPYRMPLSFEILMLDFDPYADEYRPPISYSTLANLISQQLYRVGVRVNVSPAGDRASLMNLLQTQRYDAYLMSLREPFVAYGVHAPMFVPEADILETGANVTSYNNPDVTALFEEIASVDSCDFETRRNIHRQILSVLHDDQAMLWLFSPTRMIALRDDARLLAPLVREMVVP